MSENRRVSVSEILVDWLVDNGYDGLFNHDGDCGCSVRDIVPCGNLGVNCEAGHEVPCVCGNGCDFDIAPGKCETSYAARNVDAGYTRGGCAVVEVEP